MRCRVGAGRELETGFCGSGGNEPRLGGRTPPWAAVRSKPSPLAGLKTLLERADCSPFPFRDLYASCLPTLPRFLHHAPRKHCWTSWGRLEDTPTPGPRRSVPAPCPASCVPCPRRGFFPRASLVPAFFYFWLMPVLIKSADMPLSSKRFRMLCQSSGKVNCY